MNLKEAFRFQNRIQGLMNEAQNILSRDQNVTETKNTYLRSKVMEGAEDAVLVDIPNTDYADRITAVVDFLVYLLGEKEKLFSAIRRAKNALEIDMDSEVSLNGTRQNVARILQHMNDLKSSEQTIAGGGTAYRFNTDGNQISYRCDVRRVTTINYDRIFVRRALEKLNHQSDETSARLDLCLVTSKVDYNPPIDVNASFADALEIFMARQ